MERVLERKGVGMQMVEVFDKGKDWLRVYLLDLEVGKDNIWRHLG